MCNWTIEKKFVETVVDSVSVSSDSMAQQCNVFTNFPPMSNIGMCRKLPRKKKKKVKLKMYEKYEYTNYIYCKACINIVIFSSSLRKPEGSKASVSHMYITSIYAYVHFLSVLSKKMWFGLQLAKAISCSSNSGRFSAVKAVLVFTEDSLGQLLCVKFFTGLKCYNRLVDLQTDFGQDINW